ncbi:MAG TPA: oxalate/formate MFS antiporter [Oxalicibacterium sp.]|nr:oxalate/formate MFS antiporter [Oxalicibacterium sp.]
MGTTMQAAPQRNRWWQLFFGVVAMMAISSPQYVWALFTTELEHTLGATLAEIQVTFAILIVAQTFLSPAQGFLIDKFGPRVLLSVGAILTSLSWVLASFATNVWALYLTYGLLGGFGTGIIYVGVVGLMVQWFPDLRGFAVGMVAAGYGFGAILTTFAISSGIATSGVAHTLLVFGIGIGVVGFLAAQGMRRPRPEEAAQLAQATKARDTSRESAHGYKPAEMLKTPVFWVMYLMMTMMATSGLMVISQMGAFAEDFGIHDATIFGMAALPLALTIDRFANGLTRPFFGWVSDKIGRENTMFIAFGLEGVAMTLWLLTMSNPVLFILLSGLVFFGWGEIFSLFPSVLTDTFGTKHATTNYGFLYTSQGVGSVLGGPLAAYMHQATGSWMPVFIVVIAMNFATAILAQWCLKPMRNKFLAKTREDMRVAVNAAHVQG